MSVKRICNTSESYTFRELEKGLGISEWRVFPKMALSDVFDSSSPQLSGKDKNYFFSPTHFDFVVCDLNHIPQFAVEFDGPCHFDYEEKKKKDIKKNRICALEKFPLLRVSDVELELHDSVSLLYYMAFRFKKWHEESSQIRQAIEEQKQRLSQEEIDQILSSGILPPFMELGAEFFFNVSYSFPLTEKVKSKINNIYRISTSPQSSKDVWYSLGQFTSDPVVGEGYSRSVFSLGVYQGNDPRGKYTWNEGRLNSDVVKVLYEDKVAFALRDLLPIDERYDFSISPADFYMEYGNLPVYMSEIPGASIPSICESFCEYLAYKKILQWLENYALGSY